MPASVHTLLDVAPAVQSALQSGQPVVALESTIISHGMPYPRNVETAASVEATVRENGATPATIAILDGRVKVGLSMDEIERLGRQGSKVMKCSRRDLPLVVARKLDGATTVAATMIAAEMAGIRVFATGGIGGVHRGVEETMDISADLEELAQTSVTVVCAGIKSMLDIGRSLEYLETKGVPVLGYGTDTLPAFYARDSGFAVPWRVDTAAEVALLMRSKMEMGLRGGILIGVPIPAELALAGDAIEKLIKEALADMHERNISGKDTTPFLLENIAKRSGGLSLDANIQLVINNARVAARIAVEFARQP